MSRASLASFLVVCILSSASAVAAQPATPRLLPVLSLSVGGIEPALQSTLPLAQDAYDDPRPSSGMGLIVAGWILTGLGVLNLATLPVCSADWYPSESEDLCVVLSLSIAGVGIGLGVPFLIIGYNQRSDYKAWRERNAGLSHLLNTRFAFKDDAALLLYRAEL